MLYGSINPVPTCQFGSKIIYSRSTYLFMHCLFFKHIFFKVLMKEDLFAVLCGAGNTRYQLFYCVISSFTGHGCISDLACDSCFFHQFSLSDRKSFQPLSRKLMKNLYSAWSCSTVLVTWHTYSRKPHLIRN